jgi:hypothetical protein
VTAVADGGRAELDLLDPYGDVEDVALRVAFSDTFSFAPILVDDAPTVSSRRARPRARVRRRRSSRLRMPHLRLPRLRIPRLHLPRVHMPRMHMPSFRRRPRVRRYPIDPIFLEGPRRVPVEVLDLTPSVAADLRLSARAR